MAFPVLSSDEPAVTSLSSLCSWSRVAKVEDTNKSVRGIICNMVNYFTELSCSQWSCVSHLLRANQDCGCGRYAAYVKCGNCALLWYGRAGLWPVMTYGQCLDLIHMVTCLPHSSYTQHIVTPFLLLLLVKNNHFIDFEFWTYSLSFYLTQMFFTVPNILINNMHLIWECDKNVWIQKLLQYLLFTSKHLIHFNIRIDIPFI